MAANRENLDPKAPIRVVVARTNGKQVLATCDTEADLVEVFAAAKFEGVNGGFEKAFFGRHEAEILTKGGLTELDDQDNRRKTWAHDSTLSSRFCSRVSKEAEMR
jgi:hypothetical protein